MSSRSSSGLLIAIVFIGVLIGIVGGALMGGVVGYYVARNNAQAFASSAAPQPISARVDAPPAATVAPSVTNLKLSTDSAVIETVKKVEPAVVTVLNTLQNGSGTRTGLASGSGVIIDEAGHIITNHHVVEGARSLSVIFSDGSKSDATVVGTDPVMDLAVIQIKGKVPATVSFGDASALQLGETVIAIGSPLGNYRGSVTVGVVSGLNRRVANQEGLIQTDAAINHGNSGGPLINLLGQIVGINTLVLRDTNSGDIAEGLGFAIPSNVVRDVAQQLITRGRIEYPFIGIRYTDLNPQIASELNLATKDGILVTDVTPGSPAAQGGVRAQDIITALDDNPIDENHSLRQILYKYRVGDQTTLKIQRGGQTIEVKITLVARPSE